ncbi:MAG: lytic murein transglycosylase [Candidatus Moraniibacteriota bacterium]
MALLFVVPVKHAFVSAQSDNCDAACIDDQKSEIAKYEQKYKSAIKKGDALQQDLNQINSSLTSTQQLILKVQNLLNQTEQTIGQKEQEITNLEQQLVLERHVLTGLIQELYANGNVPLPEVILIGNDLMGFFRENDGLFSTQEKMQEVIRDISEMRGKVTDEKRSLENVKADHAALLSIKNKQKQVLVVEKIETQDDLENQQATIAELNDKLAELRKDLSSFLGESITAKDIQDAAKIAANATGVRKDFLLGELVVETNLGRFTGGCTYKNTRMHSYDIPIFKTIMKDLGYSLNDKKVSCAPKSGGYGGAMGVAQFIPSTWSGWKATIAAKTGHNPADPWSITDGVMGMALKLAAGGATSKGGEKAASMIYYCGTSKPKETYAGRVAACKNYAARVQYWANNYESKL